MQTLVIIPTYNEAKNIGSLLPELLSSTNAEFLVVDDNSPDGTASIVETLQKTEERIHLLRRHKKEGIAQAYLSGFRWGLNRQYDAFVGMDADFSHRPSDLKKLISQLQKYDVVVGCRYSPEGSFDGLSRFRKGLSRAGNWYAQRLLSVPLEDLTGGFNGWQRKVLENLTLEKIQSKGYAFQLEIKAKAYQKRFRICEMPITFDNRRYGKSKMNSRIVLEAAYRVMQLRWSN